MAAPRRRGAADRAGSRRVRTQPFAVRSGQRAQCLRRPRGNRQQVRRIDLWRLGPVRRNGFQNHVSVASAETESAHSRDAPRLLLRPRSGLPADLERQLIKGNQRIGSREMNRWRQNAMAYGERCRNDARHAGRRFRVADVGLHRSQDASLSRRASRRQHFPRARTSIGSPRRVPVPCASTYCTSAGEIPARR